MSQTLQAEPGPMAFEIGRTALVIIDMQRDFLEKGGFGETLGNDVSLLMRAVEPCQRLLAAARELGVFIVHTREGHRPDLSDAPKAKLERGSPEKRIGQTGPMGRILVRGEPGNQILPELKPVTGELVIDKPGKGAFHATPLHHELLRRGLTHLLFMGVTTEVCVHTTIREGNDRGYRCVAIADACASYFPEFHRVGLEMIKAQGGIFGWVSDSAALTRALDAARAAA